MSSSDWWQDVRYGCRTMLKQPGFTATAVLTLAIGLGATAANFGIVNAVPVRPLPFREPNRLVWIANGSAQSTGMSAITTRVANYADWRRLNRSFTDLAAYFAFFDYQGYTLTGAGEPERVSAVGVSQNFLDLLGVTPRHGRTFVDEECQFNGRPAMILTDGMWERRFGRDPSAIGRTLVINGQPTQVVGILPPSFDFSTVFTPGSTVDLIVPFPISPETDRWGNTLAVIGRLKADRTVEQAQAEFALINEQLKRAHPERGQTFGARMTPLVEHINGRFRRALLVLLGAVGCVLLIACANISNLLLARGTSRQKEMAIRLALGATRLRLMLQIVTETLLLATCGAAVALPLAFGATQLLSVTRAVTIPLLRRADIDGTVLVFTLLITVLTGLVVGMAPALRMSGSRASDGLKESSRWSSEGGLGRAMRHVLVVSEIALACVLLVGAGLLVRSFLLLLDVDPGFRPDRTAAWRVETARRFETDLQRRSFYQELVRQVDAIPGVESVGLTDTLPLGRNRSWGIRAKGVLYPPGQAPTAFPRLVDPGYRRAMRIPLLSGRDFDGSDTGESVPVVIVNRTLARRLWQDSDPIGQIALIGNTEYKVVGVVGDVRHSALDQEAGSEMYLPISQAGTGAMELVVRAKESIASLVPAVRAVLRQQDPGMPTAQMTPLDALVARAVSPRRFVTVLLGGFSVLSLVLAALGIYGVISYTVSLRTAEIGIRMVLGAGSGAVLRMMLAQGVAVVATGVVLGLGGAVAVTRVVAALLFKVNATDPLTFGGIGVLLTTVAVVACAIPAWRATRVEPAAVLRGE